MSNEVNAKYDAVRCRSCGCPWQAGSEDGVSWPAHSPDCFRHEFRPPDPPKPVTDAERMDWLEAHVFSFENYDFRSRGPFVMHFGKKVSGGFGITIREILDKLIRPAAVPEPSVNGKVDR